MLKKRCEWNNYFLQWRKENTDTVLLFREQLRSFFPIVESGDDTLVIALRSGDIWKQLPGLPEGVPGWCNRDYWQPPIGFWQEVIGSRKWRRVEIITEDDGTPGFEQLLAVNGSRWVRRNVVEDMGMLIGATNLAIGTGSYGIMGALLSKSLRRLWTFANPSPRLPVHENCVPTETYQRRIVERRHMCDEEERSLTANGTVRCLRWETISHDSLSTVGMYVTSGWQANLA